ncbi:MAG TPA: UDP-3-O-(3-hydroxymyristoyl)glucosamine N-acyltransferase [Anaeromyxobacteraceae bacterium]|nr:UDP-3-O-(3-hydroxymyristoyl)glucosamine N-acyltransferase [Anaeromyxobacteraceae bacterium]
MRFTLAELAARVGGEAAGDRALVLARVAPLEDAGPEDVSFFANKKYRRAFEASRAGAVVIEPDEAVPPDRAVIRARNAYLAFARIATLFHPPVEAMPVVSEAAHVDRSARVDPSAEVMPLAYVGPEAVVGARCILHPGAHVGPRARLGDDCVLWPNAVVRDGCVLGNRVVLEPGCVVGSDGFGFAFDPEGEGGSGPRHFKVPQSGIVVVEDDVELGANTCVDRATLGVTRVGRGAKIDNLVQIAHNVEVGPLSILVGQVGIAGSSKLGAGVVAAGQVGIVGHVKIGDGAKLLAQAGITNDVPAGAVLSGSPGRAHADWLRLEAALSRLPELLKRVRELEKKLETKEAER